MPKCAQPKAEYFSTHVMPPLATQWSICKLFKQILLLCLLELLITSKQKSNQKRSPGKRLKPHSERGWGGGPQNGDMYGVWGNGKCEENWRESVQLTSKTSTARLTRATTSLQATSNYFLYFSAATKGTPEQGRRCKGGMHLRLGWLGWCKSGLCGCLNNLLLFFFFYSPHILFVFAFLALLGQAEGRAWKVGAALNRVAQFVEGGNMQMGGYGGIGVLLFLGAGNNHKHWCKAPGNLGNYYCIHKRINQIHS